MTAMTAYDQGTDVLILEKASEAHAGGNTRACNWDALYEDRQQVSNHDSAL
jgi:hypothetical protein